MNKNISEVFDNSCLIRSIGVMLHEKSLYKALPIKDSMDEFVFIEKRTKENTPN